MKKKLLFLGLVIPTLALSVVSCNGKSDGGGGSGQNVSVDSRTEDDYETWINGWSESGHLYMHYLRPKAKSTSEYDNWGIWLWPNGLEGSLWGAVNRASDATVPHPMTTERMKNIGGSGKDYDQHGVIYDIDLTRTDIIGGKTGKPVSFTGASKVGFLVADLTSMDGTKHWTSDGGADLFLEDFQSHWRSNGSMHVFLNQGDTANYAYTSGGEVNTNPTIDDTTGTYVSQETRITDKYKKKYADTSSDFAKLGIGYQIFVASFRDSNGDGKGDIRGVIEALPYLKDTLKVQCIWLTPVFKCGSYHGYDTIDYYQIDDQFGTMEDFEELIAKAKEKDIKIILDLVLNHTSKNHSWYRKSQRAEVSVDEALGKEVNWRNIYHWKFKDQKVELYNHTKGKYETVKVQNHPDWYKDGESNYYYYGKFGSGMPELNYDNQETRDLVIALGKYWLKKGVSGYRLDAVKHIYMRDEVASPGSDIIVDDIGSKSTYDNQLMQFVNKSFDYSSDVTRNVEFWKEFSIGLKSEYKNCFLVGENFDGYGARMAPYYQALDSQFDFSNFYHIGEIAYDSKGKGYQPQDYGLTQENDSYVYYRSNADNSNIYNDDGKIIKSNYPTGHRSNFINGAFTSNHDTLRAINQVNFESIRTVELKDENGKPIKDDKGNKITFNTSCVTNKKDEVGRAKVAAAMTILNSGLSWIYYGDELGMTSNTDKHIEKYGNPNNEDLWYRQPFKWNELPGDDATDEEIAEDPVTAYNFDVYTVEWDDANAALEPQNKQLTNNKSVLNYYKELCEVKAQFGTDMVYHGATGTGKVAHWYVTTDKGTYHVYVNTSASAANYDSGSGTTVKFIEARYNNSTTASTRNSLQPYSTCVVKA